MSRGRHRRIRKLNSRRVSTISLTLAAGGAAVAAPLLTAGSAHAAPVSAEKTHSASSAEPGATTKSDDASYTVVSGDTLYKIATAHDIEGGWEAVYEANRDTVGANPSLIHPGQQLSLAPSQGGDKGGAADDSSANPSSVDQAAATQGSGVYQTQSDNLDGWINEALTIMKREGIPGTYEGIHRNVMRESGGNPDISNNWDINAQNGTPSIGLLQVIKPTFDAYHVAGTANDQRDPVANIVAACNYAAQKYGSIDNVNGPY